jgi:hypothetical protein
MPEKQSLLTTAGGRIVCARCQAMSKRTKLQCCAPAEKGNRLCRFHGSRSAGPKTKAGKVGSSIASITSGEYTRSALLENDRQKALVRVLEDSIFVLNMATGPRTRGRKPALYIPVNNEDAVLDAILRLSGNTT